MEQTNQQRQTGQTASGNRSDRFRPEQRRSSQTGQTASGNRSDRFASGQWLQDRIDHYREHSAGTFEAIEDLGDMDKLGQGFTSADPLEKIDIGDGTIPRPTFVNKNLSAEFKAELINLLKEYVDCFAWEYREMPGLSRDLVEHRLPIKAGFRPFKQSARRFNPAIYDRIKKKLIVY